MRLPVMTKIEARAELEVIGQRLLALETQCEAKELDWRPWVSGDNPLSVEHWKLIQRRSALKGVLKKSSVSPEKRRAAGARLAAARKARQKALPNNP